MTTKLKPYPKYKGSGVEWLGNVPENWVVIGFKKMMDEWLRMLKSTKPAPGHDRVLVAGQPEAEVEADRRVNGIPLHPEVIQWLRDTCAELSVECLV